MVFNEVIKRKTGNGIGAGGIVVQRPYAAFFLAKKLQFIGVLQANKGNTAKGLRFEKLAGEVSVKTGYLTCIKPGGAGPYLTAIFLHAFIASQIMVRHNLYRLSGRPEAMRQNTGSSRQGHCSPSRSQNRT